VSGVQIALRTQADDAELFHLYAEVFGQALTDSSRARWEWQYLKNPRSQADGPTIWVAREEGRLLGQYASMPVRLHWGDREVSSSWGMDVFVRAEARGKGVGVKLFSAWHEHVDVALGLGLTPSSYGLFKKLGYHDVGPVPFFQKVLDPAAVARRRFGPRLGVLAAPFADLALRVVAPERRWTGEEAVRVARITRLSEDFDGLWARARSSYAMCVRRDAAYLNWKYADCPSRSYMLWEARRAGLLTGFAAGRTDDYRGLRLGWILDVFADAADRATKQALLRSILVEFRAAGVARAQAFSMNAALAADLKRRGFLPGCSPMQFCVRAKPESSAIFSDLARWHVVFGDSDMDR
jgi:GNAT superfamily N-acetyltransferase